MARPVRTRRHTVYFAEPIQHEGLEKIFRDEPSLSIKACIKSPREVHVKVRFESEGIAFKGYATVVVLKETGMELRDKHLGRAESMGRETEKQKRINEVAQAFWNDLIDDYMHEAAALLESPAYVARCQNLEQMCRTMLEDTVNDLTKTIAQIRKRVNDSWFEVGSASTASMGNMELEATKLQAKLATQVETMQYLVGPFVEARYIAQEMLGDTSMPLDTNGAPFHISLYI
jgi:hypothetical protein